MSTAVTDIFLSFQAEAFVGEVFPVVLLNLNQLWVGQRQQVIPPSPAISARTSPRGTRACEKALFG